MSAITADLTRKVGPLPVWGYGAIAGGVLLVLMSKHGSPAASAVLNPNVAAPALPGDTSTAPGSVDGTTPAAAPTNIDSVQGITAQSLFGNGTLSDLIKNLGADYTQFDFRSGGSGVDVTHSAQNAIDSQNYQAQLAYALAAQKQNWDYSLAANGQNLAYYMQSIQSSRNQDITTNQAQLDYAALLAKMQWLAQNPGKTYPG